MWYLAVSVFNKWLSIRENVSRTTVFTPVKWFLSSLILTVSVKILLSKGFIFEKTIRNKYGINVTTLRSGEEAIKYAIFGNKTDLIFMDDVMPSLSGTETLKKLKKINGFNVPVVMLTANVITGMREKYLEQGFDEYLAKPINSEELDEILIKFLR